MLNVTYLYALPLASFSGEVNVADLAFGALFTSRISTVVALLVLLCVASAANATILAAPRITFAMARDRLLPQALGAVHPRFETPWAALVVQALFAGIYVLLGSFEWILYALGFPMVVISMVTALGVYRLRRRRPAEPGSYRTPGYPVTPALFVAVYGLFAGGILVGALENSLLGIGFLATGIPVYLVARQWTTRSLRGRD
jgi:APA family basic amino acid/polyamine antiporter